MIKSKLKAKMVKSRRALAFLLTNDNPPSDTLAKKSSKQQGFTLIELLVVVSILAALAGLTSVAVGGYQQESEEKLTRIEMQRIANAIRRFKVDTGYWPKTETGLTYTYAVPEENVPANFSFLFTKPTVLMPGWNPEYAIGWHGPYIDLPAMKTIALDDVSSPSAGCDGFNNTLIKNLEKFSYGLVDRFKQLREKVTGKDYCVLTRDKNDLPNFTTTEYSASPYLYEADYYKAGNILCPNNANKCVAIRSFGPDGKDDKGIDSSDDIVFVLQQNP